DDEARDAVGEGTLGLPAAPPPRAAVGQGWKLVPHAHRPLPAGEDGGGRGGAEPCRGPAPTGPPGLLRPARLAADRAGGRGVRQRLGPRRLPEADRPAARQRTLRRALGAALARPGALRREPRLRARLRPADGLPLPRLRHPGAERGHAL